MSVATLIKSNEEQPKVHTSQYIRTENEDKSNEDAKPAETPATEPKEAE